MLESPELLFEAFAGFAAAHDSHADRLEGGEPRLQLSGFVSDCACFASPPSMRFGVCACYWFPLKLAGLRKIFNYRRTPGTAIKCAYGLFQRLETELVDEAGITARLYAERRSPGQHLP
jgi:hypothetical protein